MAVAHTILVDIDIKYKRVTLQEIFVNPYYEVEKGRGIKLAELLLKNKADIVIARENLVGKGPGYALNNTGVEIRQTNA